MINAFRLVDHVVVMTRGGPDSATELLLYYVYEIGFRLGFGVRCCAHHGASGLAGNRGAAAVRLSSAGDYQ